MQILRCKINGIYYGSKKKKKISHLRIFPRIKESIFSLNESIER